MFKNYIKLAFKVLGRRKFFTFISLFGISLTLMILMVMTAFLDSQLGAHAPISDANKMAFLSTISKKRTVIDTTLTIDTSYVNNVMQIDTLVNTKEFTNSTSTSSASFYVLDTYFRDIPHVSHYSFYSPRSNYDVFVGNKKLALSGTYTDAGYWSVYDFNFLEGAPYNKAAINNQEQVVVISNKTKLEYFGSTESAIGKQIALDEKKYTVVGVIEIITSSRYFLNGDIFLPYTHMRSSDLKDTEILGGFEGVFVAEKASYIDNVKDEIKSLEHRIPINDEDYNTLEISALTLTEGFARNLIYNKDASKSKMYFFLIVGAVFGLIVFLPTLNLINVNVTRILERSSEIGVRKAFGANMGNLLLQFVFENIILTLIGGILGFILAFATITLINDSQALGPVTLQFKTSTFVYSFLISVAFGIISGLIPAWRMSKLHIITALKHN